LPEPFISKTICNDKEGTTGGRLRDNSPITGITFIKRPSEVKIKNDAPSYSIYGPTMDHLWTSAGQNTEVIPVIGELYYLYPAYVPDSNAVYLLK
jgi:hypothetical protein